MGLAVCARCDHTDCYSHRGPQEPAWLVRHAAMESLIDALRSPELDPRMLVPPCLLPPGSNLAVCDAVMLHIDCLAAWRPQG